MRFQTYVEPPEPMKAWKFLQRSWKRSAEANGRR
jgi:hypothetical protein